MHIYQLLDKMYEQNIQFKEENENLKLIYTSGTLDEFLKMEIKRNKQQLLALLLENQNARDLGMVIYNQYTLYEYRYGKGAYLYIERLENGLTDAWRANYKVGEYKPYKIKTVCRNVPFVQAFEKSKGFIKWLHKYKNLKIS